MRASLPHPSFPVHRQTSVCSPIKVLNESLPQDCEEPIVTQTDPVSVEEVQVEVPGEKDPLPVEVPGEEDPLSVQVEVPGEKDPLPVQVKVPGEKDPPPVQVEVPGEEDPPPVQVEVPGEKDPLPVQVEVPGEEDPPSVQVEVPGEKDPLPVQVEVPGEDNPPPVQVKVPGEKDPLPVQVEVHGEDDPHLPVTPPLLKEDMNSDTVNDAVDVPSDTSSQSTNTNQNNSSDTTEYLPECVESTLTIEQEKQPLLEPHSHLMLTATTDVVPKLPVQCSDAQEDNCDENAGVVENNIHQSNHSPEDSTTSPEGTCVDPIPAEFEKPVESLDPLLNQPNGQPVDINGNNNKDNNNKDYATTFPTQNLAPGSRHQVKVLSLTSPEEFMCVLTENSGILKQIVVDLATINDSLPVVSTPSPGQPVAVFNEKHQEWCRAVITSVGVSLDIVKVYCVDIGTNDMTSLSKLKPLKKEHADQLPPQALKCQLSVLSEIELNPALVVEPWELSWPPSCTRHLNQLTQYIGGLYLEIITDCKDSGYEVKLLDYSTEPAVDLRKVLVDKLCTLTEISIVSPPCRIEHEESFENALAQSNLTEAALSNCVDQVTKGLETVSIEAPIPSSSNGEGELPEHGVSLPECAVNNMEDDLPAAIEVLPNGTQQVIVPEAPLSSHDDSDFIDGETSASTGEGDRSTGKICDADNDVGGTAVYGGVECVERADVATESTVQPAKGDLASEGENFQ